MFIVDYLLQSLEQIICFYFLCFDMSMLVSAVECICAQHPHRCVVYYCMFVLLSTYLLHFVILPSRYVYICSRFVVYWFSVCWWNAVYCRMVPVVCRFGGGLSSKVMVFGCLPMLQCLCHKWFFFFFFFTVIKWNRTSVGKVFALCGKVFSCLYFCVTSCPVKSWCPRLFERHIYQNGDVDCSY
jgi:hypothetical protein